MVFSDRTESRTKLEMKGGKIRGQGTYGCVFQPSLLCRGIDSDKSDPNKVGKITSIDDAKNELSIAKYIHTLPESSKYVIVADPKSCVPISKLKQKDPDLKYCDFSKDIPLEKTIQIIMPWGGKPLNQMNLNPKSFDIFRFAEQLLEIGGFLILNDICHMDLWGQNILFDKQNTPRLIDFGFSFRPSQLTFSDLKSRWRQISTDHDTETPEVTLMLGSLSELSIPNLIHSLQKSKPAVLRLAAICGVSPDEWGSELKEWSEQSQSFKERDWVSSWKLYWPGFDAWAIGALLLQLLELELAIPEFNASDAWATRGEIFKEMLKKLCSGHPAYRLDTLEALHMLTNGANPLVSAGSAGSVWVSEKQKKRPHP